MRWLAAIFGIMAIILWVTFSKVSNMVLYCPTLLLGMRDGVGTLAFAMAAFASLTLSASIALSAYKSDSWGAEGNVTFWGGVFLAVVFIVSALQFMLVGQWAVIHPGMYIIIKLALFLAVLGYLVNALMIARRTRK